MNEVNKTISAAAGASSSGFGPNTNGQGATPFSQPGGTYAGLPQAANPYDLDHSENGFNFVGEDSLGELVRGFVQTTEAGLAEKELERAGIRVQSLTAKRGVKKKHRRPTGVEFATLAEQFGDLMEIGESPTQVCRLLSYSQTNPMLADALLNA